MTKTKLTPVYIKWEDAFHQNHCYWTGEEGLKEFLEQPTYLCEALGWLIEDSKRNVTIAQHKSGDETTVLHIQRIPKGCILKMKRLKL